MTKLFVDIFEKQYYMKEEIISKTLWFGPLSKFTKSNDIDLIN